MNFDYIEGLSMDSLTELYEEIIEENNTERISGYHCVCSTNRSGVYSKCYILDYYKEGNNRPFGCCVQNNSISEQDCKNWCTNNCGYGTFDFWGYYSCYWAACQF